MRMISCTYVMISWWVFDGSHLRNSFFSITKPRGTPVVYWHLIVQATHTWLQSAFPYIPVSAAEGLNGNAVVLCLPLGSIFKAYNQHEKVFNKRVSMKCVISHFKQPINVYLLPPSCLQCPRLLPDIWNGEKQKCHRWVLNTWRRRQNGRHFTDNIYICIFLNENVWIYIKISLKFVAKGPTNNIPALV